MASSFSSTELQELRETSALQMAVPEIRARMLDDMNRLMHLMTETLARRAGRAPEDLAVRTFAGAMFGVMMSVALPYREGPGHEPGKGVATDVFARMDEALAMLEVGLPL